MPTTTTSTLPTIDGRGLSRSELSIVNAARNSAEHQAGRYADDNADPFPFQCGRVAAQIALRVVLAHRSTQYTDALQWPAWTDRHVWEPTDGDAYCTCSSNAFTVGRVVDLLGLTVDEAVERLTGRSRTEPEPVSAEEPAPVESPFEPDPSDVEWAAACFRASLDQVEAVCLPELAPIAGGAPDEKLVKLVGRRAREIHPAPKYTDRDRARTGAL